MTPKSKRRKGSRAGNPHRLRWSLCLVKNTQPGPRQSQLAELASVMKPRWTPLCGLHLAAGGLQSQGWECDALTVDSAPRVPPCTSKSSSNCFGPLPSDWQKHQPRDILEDPFFPFFITKTPQHLVVLEAWGGDWGRGLLSRTAPIFQAALLGSKMLQINPWSC